MIDQNTEQKSHEETERAVEEIARIVWNNAPPTQPISRERLRTLACDQNDFSEQQFDSAVDGALQANLIKKYRGGYVSVEGC